MPIRRIAIRNFRSLVKCDIDAGDLNIYVGQNDVGKSNVLRALDLFFNHDKPRGYHLNWQHDYSRVAAKRKNRAEEISIALEIVPPDSFARHEPVVWKKKWRQEGLPAEEFPVTGKSKIGAFLRGIRYDYVPAIKGEDYFQTLMGKLHDMLNATVEHRIRSASGDFTAKISEHTRSILNEIREQMGLETSIELPANLRDLFAKLEFTSGTGDARYSLTQRGDGIKVRHIPIVLKWLAEQANYRSAKGKPKVVTIWGFEEPENNLEWKRCLELAREFVDYSATIQTFVTTHSPAFYSVFKDTGNRDRVRLQSVTKVQSGASEVRPLASDDLHDIHDLDTSMGVMDFLGPHIQAARTLSENLSRVRDELKRVNLPLLLVEGKYDASLINTAWRKLFPDKTIPFRVDGSSDGEGRGASPDYSRKLGCAWNENARDAVQALFDGASTTHRHLL